jgi:hypothetical protein
LPQKPWNACNTLSGGSSPHHFRGCFEKVKGYSDFPYKM